MNKKKTLIKFLRDGVGIISISKHFNTSYENIWRIIQRHNLRRDYFEGRKKQLIENKKINNNIKSDNIKSDPSQNELNIKHKKRGRKPIKK